MDTTNNFIVYTESQYLNLSRVNMRTGERTSIRPGDPTGHIGGRRNWETWKEVGTNEEERLGNAMAPANWDGPFIISPHDASTLYAGTNILWKTDDRGDSWQRARRPHDRRGPPHARAHGRGIPRADPRRWTTASPTGPPSRRSPKVPCARG